MYVSTPQNHIIALNARTGDMIWRYIRYLPDDLQQMHPTNRGVALYGDRVYLATVDAYLVSLDALNGDMIWEVEVEDYNSGYYMTMARLVADGKVMVGVSGGELGFEGSLWLLMPCPAKKCGRRLRFQRRVSLVPNHGPVTPGKPVESRYG